MSAPASPPSSGSCLIVQPIHAEGIARLAAAGIDAVPAPAIDAATLVEAMRTVDAVIVRTETIPPEAVAGARRLRVIAKHGVGYDNIPVRVATAHGVTVVYAPGANARSAAEQAIALMLAVAKRVPAADRAQRRGEWSMRYTPGFVELHGRTLGIVGFGAIGRIVATIARHGLGMHVVVHSPNAPDAALVEAGAERASTLPELLARADVVSLHRPARPGAGVLIGRGELAAMRPGAILVNTARGEHVDAIALAEALERGHLLGAGIDVYATEPPPADHPLFGLDNVVLSPHVGSATEEAMRNVAVLCAEQVIDVLAGRRPAHPVNPEVLGSGGAGGR
jgi:D-3-phosphoglycerate dehydrogenase